MSTTNPTTSNETSRQYKGGIGSPLSSDPDDYERYTGINGRPNIVLARDPHSTEDGGNCWELVYYCQVSIAFCTSTLIIVYNHQFNFIVEKIPDMRLVLFYLNWPG